MPKKYARLAVSTACLGIFLSCSHSGQFSKTQSEEEVLIQSLLSTAQKHFQQGHFTEAIPHLENAVGLSSDTSPRGRFALFYSYLVIGEYGKARGLAEETVRLFPYHGAAYRQLGIAQLWLGETAAAIKSLRRSTEFRSVQPKTYFYLALAHARRSERKEQEQALASAEKLYQEILVKNPNEFSANYELASLYSFWNRSLEKIPDLVEHAKMGIDSGDESVEENELVTKFYLPILEGMGYLQKAEGEMAVAVFTQAIEASPPGAKADLAEVYYYLGKAQELLDNETGAKESFEKSLALDPTGPYSRLLSSKE
jgi:tetratricopeptide (TPR) repeat protein